ncbi:hypothetical protein [Phenylobacterium sp.]|uniref:hypothetical protein n=1 Tax=Phenylobacterium sp. TaxID=1871053 RepID=UPI0025EE0188|nr:hypothetical protein [Phenylobacterium sp.]
METRPFDPAAYLNGEEAIAAYLADARAHGGQEFSEAVEVAARARAPMAGGSERKVAQYAALAALASAIRG